MTALIASLTAPSPQAMRQAMQQARAAGADVVECRLDLLESPGLEALELVLKDRPLPVIVTCRPTRQGGRFAGGQTERLGLLARAARLGAEYIDLELDALGAAGELLGLVGKAGADPQRRPGPGTRLIVSQHDFAGPPADLAEVLRRLEASPADIVKVAFAAGGPEDAVKALGALRSCKKPTISLAMGEHGLASRILARKFGAFGTFAALDEGAESAPGQLTLHQMRRLYRWDSLWAQTDVFGLIGCPVGHSMSPAIHNAAFAQEKINAVYVPFRVEPGAANFDRFLNAVLAAPWLGLRGLSVTIPHKENARARVGEQDMDDLSRRIGALNTLRFDGQRLRGWNTDYAAAVNALCDAMRIRREDLAGRAVAVLGAGGAARAVVAGLTHYGAALTIYNRTVARAQRLAEEFEASAAGLEELGGPSISSGPPQTIKRAVPSLSRGSRPCEIVVNCTSAGMHPNVDESPVPAIPPGVKVVFDTIYNPLQTRLLEMARSAGCLCVSGAEMFVNQAVAQFEIWTARPAPRQLMRQVVLERTKANIEHRSRNNE